MSLFETGKMPETTKVEKNVETPMSYDEAKEAANSKLTADEDAQPAVKVEVLQPRKLDQE